MRIRTEIIDTCDDCGEFDNHYSRYLEYHYRHFCRLLNKTIERNDIGESVIPEDCPLTIYQESKKIK